MTKPAVLEWRPADIIDQALWQDCHHLFKRLSTPTFYQHPDWLCACAEQLLTQQMGLATARDEQGTARLILPLRHNPGTNTQQSARHLIEHEHLSLCDLLADPMLIPADTRTWLDAALNATPGKWSHLRAVNVPEQSPLYTLTQTAPDCCITRPGRQSARFDCSSPHGGVPGKLRRNLRRLSKQLSAMTPITYRLGETASADELAARFETFLHVESCGWKSEASSAIAAHPHLVAFYRQLTQPVFADFTPVINLLYADTQAVAAQFCIRTHRTLHVLKIGYDESWAHYSPGSLLLMEVLNQTESLEVDTVSLVTSPRWAERWHPITSQAWHVHYYQTSLSGTRQRWLDHARFGARQTIRQLIRRP